MYSRSDLYISWVLVKHWLVEFFFDAGHRENVIFTMPVDLLRRILVMASQPEKIHVLSGFGRYMVSKCAINYRIRLL